MGFTTKYVRKPLYVEAVQITEENFEEATRFCFGSTAFDEDHQEYIQVRVHQPKNQRQTRAYVGDWLLYTQRGYKVYTDKAFHANFDPMVEDEEFLGDHEVEDAVPNVDEPVVEVTE